MDHFSLKPAAELAEGRRAIPGESPEYVAARKKLLVEEIEFRRKMTRLTEQRRALPPGPIVTSGYKFLDETGHPLGLIDLFGHQSTLIAYFWMYGPERERPCPMCTNWLGSVNGNANDIKQRAALKILGRSSIERQKAFAAERGWLDLDFVQTVGDDYAKDFRLLTEDGGEFPALIVYQKDGDNVRIFYNAEMPAEAADPGQDPRTAPDIASLWNLLDLTPEGRGTDWYPKLTY